MAFEDLKVNPWSEREEAKILPMAMAAIGKGFAPKVISEPKV